jgi:hypothetical protein
MTTPVTTTFEAELAQNQPANQFKAVGGFICAAASTVAIPAAFTSGTTADLLQLDLALWKRLGLITKGDGVTFSRDFNTETEESWGYPEPTRTDITTDTMSAAFTLMETSRATLEMYDFVDLTSVTPNTTTGEIAYNKPLTPVASFRRLLYIGVDGAGTDRRYKIRLMPRGQVVGVNDEVWQTGASTKYPVTIRATVDNALGYSVRNILAGPGQKSRNVSAGFTGS